MFPLNKISLGIHDPQTPLKYCIIFLDIKKASTISFNASKILYSDY